VLYLVGGYLLAWSSEFSSIHTGFPYGWYIYIPATRDQELWVAGVPFMDSLSYVFLSYASYSLATLLLAGGQRLALSLQHRWQRAWLPIGLGAGLFVLLDVIIDPLSLRGYRWFLGQIYGYPEYGCYFGVPLSNFAGWLVVGLLMMTLLHYLTGRTPALGTDDANRPLWSNPAWGGAILYFGVLLFNLIMTVVIGEIVLGLIAITVTAGLGGMTVAAGRALARTPGPDQGAIERPETGSRDRPGPAHTPQ